MTEFVRELIQRELSSAKDNLYRAKMTANKLDPTKEYGQSGRTLDSFIDEYQKYVDKVMDELK